MSLDKREFWNGKILAWEDAKYSRHPWLDVNASVKARQATAVSYLSRFAAGKRVLEIGCGSGRILPLCRNIPLKRYVGLDISTTALEAARRRPEIAALPFPCTFLAGGVETLANHDFDLVFSLGLVDWLTTEETRQLFRYSSERLFFHSFSERRPSPGQLAHRAYVQLLYGHKTKEYRPRYWRREDLAGTFPESSRVSFHAPKQMSFGALVHNLQTPTP